MDIRDEILVNAKAVRETCDLHEVARLLSTHEWVAVDAKTMATLTSGGVDELETKFVLVQVKFSTCCGCVESPTETIKEAIGSSLEASEQP